MEGYERALRAAAGSRSIPSLIVEGNFMPERRPRRHDAPVDGRPRRPDAIFCANDLMAVGCYEALKELGEPSAGRSRSWATTTRRSRSTSRRRSRRCCCRIARWATGARRKSLRKRVRSLSGCACDARWCHGIRIEPVGRACGHDLTTESTIGKSTEEFGGPNCGTN